MKTIEVYAENIEEKWREIFKEKPTYHNQKGLTDI